MGQIDYRIRRSPRARLVRVTVDDARGVQVVLPSTALGPGRRAGERQAAAAVDELRPWIERRLRELAHAQATVAARGDRLPYLGELLQVLPEPARSRVHRRGAVLLAPCGPDRAAALERWYRRAARAEISARLDDACSATGTRYAALTIRGQRTRWASCSRSGAMSFNWRLLLAPESVLDYVVWHEVCHLEVMDHSARFWALLGERFPGYQEQARWLRRHGATLVL